MKIYLDLLPQQKKDEIKKKKRFSDILHAETMFLFPILILIIMILGANYLLSLEKDSSSTENMIKQSQEKYKQFANYEGKFKEVNELDQKLIKIESAHLNWSNLFFALSKSTPENIYISNLSTKDYEVYVIGKARERENLLKFKENLELVGCFENVNVPLADLVTKKDIDFQIDMVIKNDCLKKAWR